jgi:hypothetical protein
MVDLERAPDALMRGAGPHHEMLDEKLTTTVE